jgi:hypothetical protein
LQKVISKAKCQNNQQFFLTQIPPHFQQGLKPLLQK